MNGIYLLNKIRKFSKVPPTMTRGPGTVRTLTPETVLLVEEILSAMERLTTAELAGDQLAQRRAERDYKALLLVLRERGGHRRIAPR
ncbi:hypothetical protein [Mangrovicoccus ximenensis]|uniref:hypothetical protein n=1 Tax=Mangrovicoccus ximenensis TaxID=1911570 RepID=UPI0011AE35CE|nr:hypothetical protein [Mangrovicoccus ximenensis]